MRQIPFKNYIIMSIILITIVITTIFLANIYNNRFKKTSIMYNYLSEIKKKDMDTYIIEKPNTIVYVSDKYDISNEKIEEKIKNDIIKYNAKEYFVYLNLNDNNIDFIDNLNKKYQGHINKQIPAIIIFEEGKVINTYYDLENIDIKELTGDIK